jgi:hypothetical protein
MTIREYAQGRGKLLRIFSASWVGVVLILAFAVRPYLTLEDLRAWICAAMIPIFAVPMAIGWMTKCPRCNGRLSTVVYSVVRGYGVPDSCPHCGVSLDEPMENPADPT